MCKYLLLYNNILYSTVVSYLCIKYFTRPVTREIITALMEHNNNSASIFNNSYIILCVI